MLVTAPNEDLSDLVADGRHRKFRPGTICDARGPECTGYVNQIHNSTS